MEGKRQFCTIILKCFDELARLAKIQSSFQKNVDIQCPGFGTDQQKIVPRRCPVGLLGRSSKQKTRQQNHTTPLLQRIHFAQHVARMHGFAQDFFFDRPRRRARTSAHRQLELLPTIFSQQVRHFARRRTEWWHQMEQSGGVCTVRRNRTHLGFLLLLLLLLQPRNKSCQPNQQTTTNLGRSRRRVGPET